MKIIIYKAVILTISISSTLLQAGNLSVTKCVGPDGHLYFTDTGCPEMEGAKVETYIIQNATLSPTAQVESLKRQAQTLSKEADRYENRGGQPSEVRQRKRKAEALEREASVILGERETAALTKDEKVIQLLEDQQDSEKELARKQDAEVENQLRSAEDKVRHAKSRARAAENKVLEAENKARNAELQAKRDRKFDRLGVPR